MPNILISINTGENGKVLNEINYIRYCPLWWSRGIYVLNKSTKWLVIDDRSLLDIETIYYNYTKTNNFYISLVNKIKNIFINM